MQDANAGFKPDQLAFYAYGSRAVVAVIFETPTTAGGPYVIGTLDLPEHPALAYPHQLLPYDGEHDGQSVDVEVRDHATLPTGIYPGVIKGSSRPGNTEFWVQLGELDDQHLVRVALADITFAE